MLPERPSARLLIVNPATGAVLLLRVNDAHLAARADFRPCWVTPGGGVDPGETFEQTAVRELWEETALVAGTASFPPSMGSPLRETNVRSDALIGDIVREVRRVIPWGDPKNPSQMVSVERYFAVRLLCDPAKISDANLVENERAFIGEYRWWTQAEIRAATNAGTDVFFPEDVADYFPGA